MANRCIVIYNGVNQHVFTGKPGQRLTLNPGRNDDVDEAIFQALANGKPGSDALKLAIKNNQVELFRPEADDAADAPEKEPVTKTGKVNISAMVVTDAVNIIENTMDEAQLEAFRADEAGERNRKGVQEAIEKQLKALAGNTGEN